MGIYKLHSDILLMDEVLSVGDVRTEKENLRYLYRKFSSSGGGSCKSWGME